MEYTLSGWIGNQTYKNIKFSKAWLILMDSVTIQISTEMIKETGIICFMEVFLFLLKLKVLQLASKVITQRWNPILENNSGHLKMPGSSIN